MKCGKADRSQHAQTREAIRLAGLWPVGLPEL